MLFIDGVVDKKKRRGKHGCYSLYSIPVVMITVVGYELNVKLSRAMGADGYITKPFSQQNLLDTIARFLKSPK